MMDASTCGFENSKIQFSDLGGIQSASQHSLSQRKSLPQISSSPSSPGLLVNSAPTVVNDIFRKISDLENEVTLIKASYQQVIIDNKILQNDYAKLTIANRELRESLYSLEVEVANCDQYSRRENIELLNIPESIPQKDLEAHVIDVLKSIKVDDNICSYNIVAAHRLCKKRNGRNRSVIVRFINRKHAILALKNKKLLSNNVEYRRYIITENLGPKNREIYDKCYKLKKSGIFKSLWTYNGRIHVKFSDSYEEYPTKIYHYDDIEYCLNHDCVD